MAGGVIGSASAHPLDPLDFASLGALNLAAGDFVIDTDALTITDVTGGGSTLLFTGVADDQGGTADTFNGVWDPVANPGQLGIPEIAVFTFDGIDLQPTAGVTITGTRAIALLSHGDATIGTPLSVDGGNGAATSNDTSTPINLPGAGAGAGGFGGGTVVNTTALPGGGLGGGGAVSDITTLDPYFGGPGSFGGSGLQTNNAGSVGGTPGPTYGDLLATLQGGSGGSGVADEGFLFVGSSGAGGGGAIELGAAGLLQIDATVTANGGNGVDGPGDFLLVFGGSGSGGGIRVHGQQVLLNGQLDAAGGTNNFQRRPGGGGRVLVNGLGSEVYTVGQPTPDLSDTLAKIDASHGAVGQSDAGFIDLQNSGVITLRPALTIVPAGETYTLAQTIDVSTTDQRVFFLPRELRVLAGGSAQIAGDTTNQETIELAGATAAISGAGFLFNDRVLTGTGRVETLFNNRAGGAVTAVNDTLIFTQQASSAGGSEINAVNSTLVFEQGLNSAGDVNLINSTLDGDLVNNGVVSLAGVNTFTGVVSGSGAFTGTGTGAFSGTLAPGASPGLLTFEGDLDLKPAATLQIEIAGTTPGSEHDRIEVGGFATLEGALNVTLLDGFIPELGDSFAFLFASGAFDASFAAINLPDLSTEGLAWELNPGGSTLFLEAVPALDGDFNLDGAVDAADYTVWRDGLGTAFTPIDYNKWFAKFGATAPESSTSVPEPTAGLLLMLAVTAGQQRRRN